MLTRSVVLAFVTIVAVLAGCGGKATATGAGGTVAVTEGDTFLDQPYFVETNPGGKSTGTVTLPEGTYELFCSIPGHEAATAKLIVE